MKYLVADENAIVNAEVAGISSLKLLSLKMNDIEEVPDLSELKKLENLDLSHNRLVIGFEKIAELKSLKVLDLSFNSIEMSLPEFHK